MILIIQHKKRKKKKKKEEGVGVGGGAWFDDQMYQNFFKVLSAKTV